MNRSNFDNFLPISPTSLYSTIVPPQDFPYAGAGLSNTATVSSKPQVSTTESTQPPEVIVAKSSKSILKNPKTRPQITKTPPAKLQIPQKTSPAKPRLSRPPSRSTTPVNRAVKQKTVAFGLTTNLSDTVEKTKEAAASTLCAHRPKSYMTTTKEAEEIAKQLKSLKEEFGSFKTKLEGENAELRKSLEEMFTKETKLSNLLTNLSSRLMDLEQKHDQSVGSNSPHVQDPDNKLVNTSAQTIGSAGDRKERDGNAAARRKDIASAPVKAGGPQRDSGQIASRKDIQQRAHAMVPYQQDSMAVNKIADRDVQIEHFVSFIKQKIREDPRFEERINRTVSLFGGSPGEILPQTLESRAPFREKE
ncbi:spindle assembly abnormal protein 5 [Ditylenchus destructor]|uniref:Spindle assembly abnormal protein 5 n=1 Tax=Ditylenchus destructor TaxID=166010 RepID=A0AAD4NDJ5_9BILA|nr:spindle assembly abnormal protein 5 [Ditylenchus destructor]